MAENTKSWGEPEFLARLGCPSRRYVGGTSFALCECPDPHKCPAPVYAPFVADTQPQPPHYHRPKYVHRNPVPQAPNLAAYLAREVGPMPGDVVRLSADWYGSNTAGVMGVLDGVEGHAKDEYLCVLRPSAFRGPSTAFSGDKGVFISCSGGPCPFIRPEELVWTGETVQRWYWMWRATPEADGGINYQLEVPVWDWAPRG